MSRFNVYPNPSGAGYLDNVQADFMQPFNTSYSDSAAGPSQSTKAC